MRNLLVNIDNIREIGLALSNDIRIEIIKILSHEAMSVNEIAERLDIPFSTAAVNIKKLEEAGLLSTEIIPGRGTRKVSSLKYHRILIDLHDQEEEPQENSVVVQMPIGEYVDIHAVPTCGLTSEKNYIGVLDDIRSFYEPEKIDAQLLWFKHGFVEYRFPNRIPYGAHPIKFELSAEICSEAPYHKKDWPSDITVWVNNLEIGTWTCPGDFGGERGVLTPSWWAVRNTQYGMLKNWSISSDGTFLDGIKISDVCISDFNPTDHPFISIKFGIKDDAYNKGGLNLFGKKFGNYEQDIILKITYAQEENGE